MSYGQLNIGETTTVTGSNVRVRKTAVDGEVLYSAAKGTKVKILAKDNHSEEICWYQIQNLTNTSKPNGWIRGDYLAGSDISFWDNDALFSTGKIATESTGLNLRSGPGSSYSVVTVIPKGATVKYIASGETWVPVKYNSYRGYCDGSYITYVGK